MRACLGIHTDAPVHRRDRRDAAAIPGGAPRPVSPALYAAVLAVVREALNTARHTRPAPHLCVEVVEGQLRITLEDNGIGVSDDDRIGSGRSNIQNRAAQFGGHATIHNGDIGYGTVVEWAVPLVTEDQAADAYL